MNTRIMCCLCTLCMQHTHTYALTVLVLSSLVMTVWETCSFQFECRYEKFEAIYSKTNMIHDQMSIFLLPFFIWVSSLVSTQCRWSVVNSLQLLTSDTRLLLVSGDQLVWSLTRSLRKGWYQCGLCVQWTAWYKKGLLGDEECGSNSALCFLIVWRLANVSHWQACIHESLAICSELEVWCEFV